MPEVSLFPIPNVIAFPGTVLPLHIFEPRYRTMVDDCINFSRIMGVCHTKKEISAAPKNQTREQSLSANQATYQPFEVFSAGQCEIIERTSDGRILANVHVADRYIISHEIQTLPYRVVSADLLKDEPLEQDVGDLCTSIHKLFLSIIETQNSSLSNAIKKEKWTELPPGEYSFKLFQFLRFEPELMQELLSSTNVKHRLDRIHQILNGNSA